MKRYIGVCVLITASAFTGSAQEPARVVLTAEGQSMAPARAATVVETRITTGRPYSAEAITEFVQVLGDGNKIVRKATVRIHRDGEGRTRREELAADGSVRSVSIYDPVAHVTYVLDPATRTARKSAMRVVMPTPAGGDEQKREIEAKMLEARERAGGRVALVAPAAVPALAGAEEIRKRQVETAVAAGAPTRVLQPAARPGTDVKEESLGQKSIDGVLADGKRVTTVLAAGLIGNQQPITMLSEQWFSPDLEILLMTKHSDPRSGETTYTLSNISRAEPAAGLFDVPADYTIQDSSYIRTPAR